MLLVPYFLLRFFYSISVYLKTRQNFGPTRIADKDFIFYESENIKGKILKKQLKKEMVQKINNSLFLIYFAILGITIYQKHYVHYT